MTTDLGMPAVGGLALVPQSVAPQTAEDYTPGDDVRWCPGCGDYGVLTAIREFLPKLGIPRENVVFISGIGCSSRFPYYLDTYGLHSIHGRALPIATGLAVTRPELSVWVVTGDGDALSIGGNHLLHALRRNVNVKILLFDNKVYGLTKGQYSPTSDVGTVTKSTPAGSIDTPLNPLSLALGAGATFVARAIDVDRPGLNAVLAAAVAHRGTTFIQILQDCPVFNPGAFDVLRMKSSRAEHAIALRDGAPIRFGRPAQDGLGARALIRDGSELIVSDAATVAPDDITVHDVTDLNQAFALARLSDGADGITVTGILHAASRSTYDDLAREQARSAVAEKPEPDLQALLRGPDCWTVGA